MRDPDLHRICRAVEHLDALKKQIDSIKWERLSGREPAIRRSVYEHIESLKWALQDFYNIGKREK